MKDISYPFDSEELVAFLSAQRLISKGDSVVLGGSATYNPNYNDIDIIILTNRPTTVSARVTFWKTKRIEVFYHTVGKLISLIQSDAQVGKFGKGYFIWNGRLLISSNEYNVNRLFACIKHVMQAPKPAVNKQHLAFFMLERISALRQAKRKSDELAGILALMNGYEQNFHLLRDEWLLTGKHFLRDLQNNHSIAFDYFCDVVQQAMTGNTAPICLFMEEWVASYCTSPPDRIEM